MKNYREQNSCANCKHGEWEYYCVIKCKLDPEGKLFGAESNICEEWEEDDETDTD